MKLHAFGKYNQLTRQYGHLSAKLSHQYNLSTRLNHSHVSSFYYCNISIALPLTVSLLSMLSANFSRLVMYFRFERQIGHHLIQTFAPSTLVVMLSWFSFWIGLDAIPGRVTLLVTSMLTLVTMFTGLKSDIPPVAYVKVRSSMLCF